MKKFILFAFTALLMTSCLTNAILSTVLLDKKTATARQYGDAIVVNVKAALKVTVTADQDWVSFSEKSFTPGLDGGQNLIIYTQPATSQYTSKCTVTVAMDKESYAELVITREGKNDNQVSDIHGNSYKVVKIGNQYWMADNLKSGVYDTKSEPYGKILTKITNGERMSGMSCFDPRESSDILAEMIPYKDKMGYQYSWCGAMGVTAEDASTGDFVEYDKKRQGICPNGFHLPSKTEFNTLVNYASGKNTAGKYLKSKEGWETGAGNDTYGFNGYPAGQYDVDIVWGTARFANFWSSTSEKYSATQPAKYYMYLESSSDMAYITTKNGEFYEKIGFSVRCIRD